MNKSYNMLGEIIENYAFLLVGFILFFLIKIVINYRKKITYENKCPFCKTINSERVSRDLFTKLIYFNDSIKKFKCLKCWKNYYVREPAKKANYKK